MKPKADAQLDLALERHADVSPTQVWKAWTTPEHVAEVVGSPPLDNR